MSIRWYAVRRIALAVFTTYLILTMTFGFIALTEDPGISLVAYGAAHASGATQASVQKAIDDYKEAHNLDKPVWKRYVEWLGRMTTLDWGRSFTYGRPVTNLVWHALKKTFTYLLPAMVVSMLAGVSLGLYSGTNRGSIADRVSASFGYFGLAMPSFWVAAVLKILFIYPIMVQLKHRPPNAAALMKYSHTLTLAFAILALSMTLLAGQLRYTRAEVREYTGTQFIKTARAKGAGSLRIARHILRNAAIPLVSLFFTDMLAVLVVNVFVIEAVLGIGGIGNLGLVAIRHRDMPLIIGTTMSIVLIGIAGNLVQDFVYLMLDPRVDYGE